MKKILCTLLCIALLLSGLALAEGSKITLKKLTFKQNEEVILALENLGLALGFGAQDNSFGAHLDLTAGDSDIICAAARMLEDGLVFSAKGLLEEEFVISMTDIVALINSMTAGQTADAQIDISGIDVAAITGAFETFAGSLAGSFREVENVSYAGRTLSGQAFTVKNDDLMALLGTLAGEIDKVDQLKALLAQSGYDSFAAMVAAIPFGLDVEGMMLADESFIAFVLDTIVEAGEGEGATVRFALDNEIKGNRDGYDIIEGVAKIAGIQGGEEAVLMNIDYTLGTVEGNFAFIEAVANAEGQEAFDMHYYTSIASETGNNEFALSGEGVLVLVSANETGFDAQVTAGGESVTLSFNESSENAGLLELGVSGSTNAAISAEVAIVEDDCAWLTAPVENPVNVMTMDEAQINAISAEVQGAVLPLLIHVLGEEPALMALAGGMLGQ